MNFIKPEKFGQVSKHTNLSDPRPDGTERPWKEKKVKTVELSESFGRLGEQTRSERIRACGTFLEFLATADGDSVQKILKRANFCKCRLCPMCQWRRSLQLAFVLSSVMDAVENEYERLRPVFLTLTVRNCLSTAADLKSTLDMIFNGWNRFLQVKRTKAAVEGWFRAFEVTYNSEADTFHPHLHAVVFVDKKYFSKGYIKTAEWVQLWRFACRLDYDPICDIRRVRNDKARRKDINEVSKYTVKDTDFITNNDMLTDRLVAVLNRVLRGRRLNAFGGVMKQLVAKLKFVKDADDDLVHVGDGTIREDVEAFILRYFWHFGRKNYFLKT